MELHLRMTDSAGNEFSLALPHPSFNTLLGPTGSGKTSLLRRIAGLEPSPPGSVRLGDRSLDTLPPRLRNVSMVYQQFVNYPSLTAFENIASPLRCQGVSRDAVTARVLEVARSLHIEELLNRLPESLSGGQQQRVALGRALAKDSDLVLLDEPLANLDYKLREELRRVIPRLFKDRDATVLYATSDPQEALELASNTIVLSQGRVAQTGPADYLYAAPANRDVAEILTHPPINVMAGHLTPSELVIPEILTTPRPAHAGQLQAGPVLVGVRPGDLLLTDAPGATRLHAQVELSEVSGSETFLHLKAGGCALVAHEPGLHPRPLGASLDVFAVPSTFLLFDEAGQTLAAPGAPNA